MEVARNFVADMKSIPHLALPMSAEVAEEAMALYLRHGGRRKLSYFDAFHVATAKRYDLTFLTTDKFILQNAKILRINTTDLTLWSQLGR